MIGALGLALKDHGMDRTLKGLGAGDPRVVPVPVMGDQDPSGSVVCHGPSGPGRISQSWGAPRPKMPPRAGREPDQTVYSGEIYYFIGSEG